MSTGSIHPQRRESVDEEQLDVMGGPDVNDRRLDVIAGPPGAEPKGADVMSEDDREG